MTPEEVVDKLRKNRDKIRMVLWHNGTCEYSNNVFQNMSNQLNAAKDVIGASDGDFYAYVIARLNGKV